MTRPAAADLASLLDKRLGLSQTTTPAANSLGLGEKWLARDRRDQVLPDPGRRTVPNVRVATSGLSRTLVAQLDPAYFNDPRLLADAKPHPLPVHRGGELVTVGPEVGAVGDFVVQVTAADATATARRTFHVHVTNPSAPSAAPAAAQVLGAGETLLRVNLGPADADGDAVTYQVRAAGTEAYFLATDLGLKPDPKHKTNWGGQGEKWFLGRDGTYVLKPSGDFLKWDGTDRQATGGFVATLQPAYFVFPDLLTRPQDEDLAYVLDRKLGLSPTITPAENSLGQGERWFKGKKGYFFITPAGDLYQQGPESPLLASLGPVYFQELNRLYAAQPDRFAAAVTNGVLDVTTKPDYFGRFVVQVRVTDGVNTTTRLIPVEQRFVAPDPANPSTTNPPRMTGAVSTGNKKVVVSFSQAMSNTALDPANYAVSQTVVNPQAGELIVTGGPVHGRGPRLGRADHPLAKLGRVHGDGGQRPRPRRQADRAAVGRRRGRPGPGQGPVRRDRPVRGRPDGHGRGRADRRPGAERVGRGRHPGERADQHARGDQRPVQPGYGRGRAGGRPGGQPAARPAGRGHGRRPAHGLRKSSTRRSRTGRTRTPTGTAWTTTSSSGSSRRRPTRPTRTGTNSRTGPRCSWATGTPAWPTCRPRP